jgi:hypothetical protein
VSGTGRRRRHAPLAKRPGAKRGRQTTLDSPWRGGLRAFSGKEETHFGARRFLSHHERALAPGKGKPLDRPAIRGSRRPCILPPPRLRGTSSGKAGPTAVQLGLTATCEIPAERVESRPFSWEDKARIGRKAIRSRKRLPDNDLPPVPYTPRHCRAGWRGHAGSAEPRERP